MERTAGGGTKTGGNFREHGVCERVFVEARSRRSHLNLVCGFRQIWFMQTRLETVHSLHSIHPLGNANRDSQSHQLLVEGAMTILITPDEQPVSRPLGAPTLADKHSGCLQNITNDHTSYYL